MRVKKKRVIVRVCAALLVISPTSGFTTNGTLSWPRRETVALLVEPRRHALLVHVVTQFASVLGADWRFHVFHGTGNADLACDARRALQQQHETCDCEGDESARVGGSSTASSSSWVLSHDRLNAASRVALTSLGVADLTPKDAAYNGLLTSPLFWDAVAGVTPGSSHALVFHTDTALCSPGPPISAFLQYAYVGAPWGEVAFLEATRTRLHDVALSSSGHITLASLTVKVGNGGLSLRRVDAMVAISADEPWDQSTPEDVWFSAQIQRLQAQGAASETAGPRIRALPAPPAPLPGVGDGGGAATLLEVGGASVALDAMGPIIVNSDGTTSRITNWGDMDDREQGVAWRRIAKRNQQRLAKLRERQAEAKAEAKFAEAVGSSSGESAPGDGDGAAAGGASSSSAWAGASGAWGGVAPFAVAATFSVESVLPECIPAASPAECPFFGVRAPERFLHGEAFAVMARRCPAALDLFPRRPALPPPTARPAAVAGSSAETTTASSSSSSSSSLSTPLLPIGSSRGVSASCSVSRDSFSAPWASLVVDLPCAAADYDLSSDAPLLTSSLVRHEETTGHVDIAAAAAGGQDAAVSLPVVVLGGVNNFGCDTADYPSNLRPPSEPRAKKGCSAADSAVVVARRGGCSFRAKARAAQAAGAAALLIITPPPAESLASASGSSDHALAPQALGPCAAGNSGCAVSIPVASISSLEPLLEIDGSFMDTPQTTWLRGVRASVTLRDDDLELLRGDTTGRLAHLAGKASAASAAFTDLVLALVAAGERHNATATNADDTGLCEHGAGDLERDARAFAAAQVGGLIPLTRAAFAETFDFVVDVNCHELLPGGGNGPPTRDCVRSLARLVSVAPRLPPLVTVSVPGFLVLAFAASVLPRLSHPILVHVGGGGFDVGGAAALLDHPMVAHVLADDWPGPWPRAGNASELLASKLTVVPAGFSDASDAEGAGLRALFEAAALPARPQRALPVIDDAAADDVFRTAGRSESGRRCLASFHHSDDSAGSAGSDSDGGNNLGASNDRAAALQALAPSGIAFFDRPRGALSGWRLRRGHDAGHEAAAPSLEAAGLAPLINSGGGDVGDSLSGPDYEAALPWDLEACPAGHAGAGAHRVWEALALGLLPVVTPSPLWARASGLGGCWRSPPAIPAGAAAGAATGALGEGLLCGRSSSCPEEGRFPLLVVPSWEAAAEAMAALPRAAVEARTQAPTARAVTLARLSVGWWADLARGLQASCAKRAGAKN